MRFLFLLLVIAFATQSEAENMIDHSDWTYLADTVMGGVSTGTARVENLDRGKTIHLKGSVSTENNGGFIQFRHDLKTSVQPDQTGIRIKVRGNNQTYYVHLRTAGTILPWHYYQAAFDASDTWREIRLPFDRFEKSNKILRKTPKPTSLKSIGIVAYGRAHIADIQIAEIGCY